MTATRRIPVVLFLIADTGGGHRSAANAIRAAMDLIMTESLTGERPAAMQSIDRALMPFNPHDLQPQNWNGKRRPWRAEIHDIFQECGLGPLKRTARLYGPTVEKTPLVYASLYRATNTRPTYAALSVVTNRMLRHGLRRLIGRMRPDLIVSVHPLLTHATLSLVQSLDIQIPFITVVTDLIRFHRAWAEPRVDICCAPTKEAREQLIEFGMPKEKILLLGMPIHPKFALPPVERETTRAFLGLDADRYTVLLVGGGDGVGGIGEATESLAKSGLPLQLVVVTGRNRELYEDLTKQAKTYPVPCSILSFVQNMPDLMHAADVIVTKAGPGSIMEALSCGLPIILLNAIPGQEEGNITFVQDHHVGVYSPEPEEIVKHVQKLLTLSPEQREEISLRAKSLSNARATFNIAQLILSNIPASSTASPWSKIPTLRRRDSFIDLRFPWVTQIDRARRARRSVAAEPLFSRWSVRRRKRLQSIP